MTRRWMAIGFGVIAVAAAIYTLAALRPASPPAEPSAPVPPTAGAPSPNPSPLPKPSPPPAVPIAPADRQPPAPLPPPPAAPLPALRVNEAEAAELEPIVAAIRQGLAQVKKDFEAGKLTKKQVGEALQKADAQAKQELGRRLGADRARQYLEVLHAGGEVSPSRP